MILPDVNVLIYALRQDVQYHAVASEWLKQVILGESRFGISRLVLAAVIRISTDRRMYSTPSSIEDAVGFCNDILDQPHCQIVEPGEKHWHIFTRLCIDTNTTGPRVTDAWYAALAIEHDCEWITFDRDFSRFPGLKWSQPASS